MGVMDWRNFEWFEVDLGSFQMSIQSANVMLMMTMEPMVMMMTMMNDEDDEDDYDDDDNCSICDKDDFYFEY